MDHNDTIREIRIACRRLLSEQQRDPHAITRGCFDRRYWAWKLVDFPEATYQRNVLPLAWLSKRTDDRDLRDVLISSVKEGLLYTVSIQHADGSFDQAFPNEHSFGATGFILNSLIEAYNIVKSDLDGSVVSRVDAGLQKAAHFLCKHDERHGFISNHVAGAAIALYQAANLFGNTGFRNRADELLNRVLSSQSREGWFPEYGGADPGYQTLCLHYLAKIYEVNPTQELDDALERAVNFVASFAHPDGTFGGEYGSRRTSLFYPGGVALLAKRYPVAAALTRFMSRSIANNRTTTLGDVDIGNIAPLLSNYIALVELGFSDNGEIVELLPCEREAFQGLYEEAGVYVHGTPRFYTVVGASNGGVVKVFDKRRARICYDDGGYVGHMCDGKMITTQSTDLALERSADRTSVQINAPFYGMPQQNPTPSKYTVLRLLNISLMRNIKLGNMFKKGMVKLLMSRGKRIPLRLNRVVKFDADRIIIEDELEMLRRISLKNLEHGRPFIGLHMASAGYYEQNARRTDESSVRSVDVEKLFEKGSCIKRTVIE